MPTRLALLGASFLVLLLCALPARAQQYTLCTALLHNYDNPFDDGRIAVSPVFPTSVTAAYEAQWTAYIEEVYGDYVHRTVLCSEPGNSEADAIAGRSNLIYKWSGELGLIEPDWHPQADGGTTSSGYGSGAGANGYDATGALGGRIFCMLQETRDGQPRALFSQVFSPPELESDLDVRMGHRFVQHAQAVYSAQPDAVATCHRTDSEARAHNDRDHEAEMRRIKGWTVIMTEWSE